MRVGDRGRVQCPIRRNNCLCLAFRSIDRGRSPSVGPKYRTACTNLTSKHSGGTIRNTTNSATMRRSCALATFGVAALCWTPVCLRAACSTKNVCCSMPTDSRACCKKAASPGMYLSQGRTTSTNDFGATICYACTFCDCPAGTYSRSGGTSQTDCQRHDNVVCRAGTYRTGVSTSKTNNYQCQSCSSTSCATDYVQTGVCSGTSDGFR